MDLLATITNWIVIGGSAILIAVIVVSWLVSIRTLKVTTSDSSLWFDLPGWAQIGLGIGVIVLFISSGVLLWIHPPLKLSPTLSAILNITGLAVFLTGLSLALWARWALGAMYGVSTSSSAPLQKKHRLVQRGPYVFIRHPMYLGYWLVLLGVLLTYRTWTPLALLAMTVPSFYRRAQREEVSLDETFGTEWQTYVASVPMFLPRLKTKTKENQ
ncbi:MAG: hypothetical protein A2Z16_02040 [Chloroflexi bacterium RBG_16_54_18]|nr:MAG: hypothetical protein A2Z16_02040 [Chloroflexi bacterium RBG_16_54_18]